MYRKIGPKPLSPFWKMYWTFSCSLKICFHSEQLDIRLLNYAATNTLIKYLECTTKTSLFLDSENDRVPASKYFILSGQSHFFKFCPENRLFPISTNLNHIAPKIHDKGSNKEQQNYFPRRFTNLTVFSNTLTSQFLAKSSLQTGSRWPVLFAVLQPLLCH